MKNIKTTFGLAVIAIYALFILPGALWCMFTNDTVDYMKD